MSKRDNPRLLQREAERQKERRQRERKQRETRQSEKRQSEKRQPGRKQPERKPGGKYQDGGYQDRRYETGGYEAGRRRGGDDPRGKRQRTDLRGEFPLAGEDPNLIIGRNPVMEAVKSGRQIEKLLMQKDGEGSVRKIAALARERKILIQYVDRAALDRLCPGRPHQGVAALAAAHDYCQPEDILAAARERGEDPFVVILDGLEDPHNLGAIMRTADAAGVHGIIIPSRRAVGLTETVAKASAGAIEYVPVAKVGNLVQTIEKLKEAGLWIAALDMDGQDYTQAELSGPVALVVGGEGQGVSRLVRESCDYVLSIPMKGKITSLNASNAAAILMYEVYRRRAGEE